MGANAVVIEGVQVGNGSVVAAGAIVTQDVPENVVVAGVPARVIKTIDEQTQQKQHLRMLCVTFKSIEVGSWGIPRLLLKRERRI